MCIRDSYDIVPIESAVHGLEAALTGIFAGAPRDVTEENLQARARGVILMAISNKFGLMVVTTGNKSEMSVGYATVSYTHLVMESPTMMARFGSPPARSTVSRKIRGSGFCTPKVS